MAIEKRKTGKRKLKKEVWIVLIAFAILLLTLVAMLIYKSIDKFDYVKSQRDVVLSISKNSVSDCNVNIALGEITYYVIAIERDGQKAALMYNEHNPNQYWNLYMNKDMTDSSGYISTIAKESVITYCMRDCIYDIEARLEGFNIDEDAIEDLEYDAEYEYYHLSDREQEMCGLTLEQYKKLYMREERAHRYMLYLAEKDGGNILENISLKYDVSGNYYQGLLTDYSYSIDEKLWENVRIGHVTVN